MIKFKNKFYYSRIALPLWFLFLAVLTVFLPKTGIYVLEAYILRVRKDKDKNDLP